jgi:hypothetical protein
MSLVVILGIFVATNVVVGNQSVGSIYQPSLMTQIFGIPKDTWGDASVIAQLRPSKSKWIVAANENLPASCRNDCSPNLVIAAALFHNGTWHVDMEQRFPITEIGLCGAQFDSRLVPDQNVVILDCYDGGTDGESYVVVAGFSPGVNSTPRILYSADCEDTSYAIKGTELEMYSFPLKAYGSQQVGLIASFAVRWRDGKLTPRPTKFCIPAGSSWFND